MLLKCRQYSFIDSNSISQKPSKVELISNNTCGLRIDMLNIACTVTFRGNIAPVMEWCDHNGTILTHVDGVRNDTVYNSKVTYSLVTPATHQMNGNKYTCTTTVPFTISNNPFVSYQNVWTSPTFDVLCKFC